MWLAAEGRNVFEAKRIHLRYHKPWSFNLQTWRLGGGGGGDLYLEPSERGSPLEDVPKELAKSKQHQP